jgi:hypothetical protein
MATIIEKYKQAKEIELNKKLREYENVEILEALDDSKEKQRKTKKKIILGKEINQLEKEIKELC